VIGLTDLIVKETSSLNGTIEAPPSKAYTHRAFIAATLSEGHSHIERPLICDDTLATIDACRLIGAELSQPTKEGYQVLGRAKPLTPWDVINCRDSASTMRFLTPVCALTDGISVLTGGESLRRRPMEPILKALRQLGVQCYSVRGNGLAPLIIFGGGIKGGKASIRGDVSSQFISGLLLASPMAENDTKIVLSTPLESKPYVEITLDVLRKHGIVVEVQPDHDGFQVPCGQRFVPFDHHIEGDYSSAAFLMAIAATTDSRLKIMNLGRDTLQGDRAIINLLKKMGVKVEVGLDFIKVQGNKSLQAIDIDMKDNPDLVPVCTFLAFFARGRSLIRGVKRLRFKESDRVLALSRELTKLGAKIRAVDDILEVEGGIRLHAAELDSHGDHRIAMACVVAALRAKGTSVVRGVECINKSYPDFVRDIASIGGEIVER